MAQIDPLRLARSDHAQRAAMTLCGSFHRFPPFQGQLARAHVENTVIIAKRPTCIIENVVIVG
jgi:hypothetical protein